eukprot:gnl/TRDRNA2_/TRDRNA2_33812_c0_seq1.p1 gnl/TRDRNA2_/TRDRNA2_33812_c0~~gnl/TRDRNA2_/TRDRNA2_33812_c0_seq1.p1  ORF type:complete len:190 (+),score=19.50 gnl/TRDRNA2_/TRDRNA2_33812_c0_seq1:112-681(+)
MMWNVGSILLIIVAALLGQATAEAEPREHRTGSSQGRDGPNTERAPLKWHSRFRPDLVQVYPDGESYYTYANGDKVHILPNGYREKIFKNGQTEPMPRMMHLRPLGLGIKPAKPRPPQFGREPPNRRPPQQPPRQRAPTNPRAVWLEQLPAQTSGVLAAVLIGSALVIFLLRVRRSTSFVDQERLLLSA